MNPRVDTEGDGELRAKIVNELGAAMDKWFQENPFSSFGPPLEYIAAHLAGVFGDVERELARLREAAVEFLTVIERRGDAQAVHVAARALRDVLAAAVQSEHPKQ